MKGYLLLTFFWLLFYVPHSVLALESIKKRLSQTFPFLKRYYRLLYNVQSLLLFGNAFYYQRQLQSQFLFQVNSFFYIFSIALMLFSFFIMALSFRHYDKYEFLGLQQFQQANFNVAIGSTLNVKGLNQFVRHPLYSATFLFLFGYLLYKPLDSSLIFVIISSAYLFVGTWLEEKKLSNRFGEVYKQYQRKVPMFLPFTLFQFRR
jgi:protein-S-isoprenylcysteine O-methyltransferase Ste14